jgi:hypothetical protein
MSDHGPPSTAFRACLRSTISAKLPALRFGRLRSAERAKPTEPVKFFGKRSPLPDVADHRPLFP